MRVKFFLMGMCLLVLPLQAATHEVWVTASAHVAGGYESNWRTDVHIYNEGGQTASVSVSFLAGGPDQSAANLARDPMAVEVGAGSQVKVPDILLSLFGLDSASGSLLFASEQPIRVVSRTYNKLAAGEYGQFIGGVPASNALAEARLVGAVGAAGDEGFRTNLGFVNPSRTVTAAIALDFLNAKGAVLKSTTLTFPPFTYLQYNDLFAYFGIAYQDPVTIHYASNTPVLGYLSTADKGTNDPIYVPGLP